VAEIAQVEAYLHFVHFEAAQRADSGMSALEAAFDIDLGDYGAWSDSERIVANVDAVYSEVRPGHSRMNVIALFGEMGRYRASRRPASS
jgi:cyclase